MKNEILDNLHQNLQNHEIYKSLKSIDDLKVFMKWHSFAVWDFMSLLKSLQTKITCITLPWKPSPYPKELVRFINEIVVGEESDSDGNGSYIDHFTMYLNAMGEVGASIDEILYTIETLDFTKLPAPIKEFVEYNINLSLNGKLHEVASAFFYGRENLVPDIFRPIVAEINQHNLNCPNFLYYLERHIELDGEEHGHLAQKCLEVLIDGDPEKELEAINAAKNSLYLRAQMWSFILGQIESR